MSPIIRPTLWAAACGAVFLAAPLAAQVARGGPESSGGEAADVTTIQGARDRTVLPSRIVLADVARRSDARVNETAIASVELQAPAGAIRAARAERSVHGAVNVGTRDGKAGARLLAASPTPALTFPGVTDSAARQIIPPDVGGAVGPNHVMVVHNSYVRVQTRSGVTVSTVTLNGFWSSAGAPSSFDPKAVYDPYDNRWIFVSCGNAGSPASVVLLGVSQTSDPTGGWYLYNIDADPANVNWADFPYVGFNKDRIAVTMNMFGISSGYNGWKTWVVGKASIYSGLAITPTIFTGTDGFSLAPVATYDVATPDLYVVDAVWQAGSGDYNLRRISGPAGSETMTTVAAIATAPGFDMWPPTTNWGPQAGTTSRIAVNDGRIGNAVFRNGSIWLVHPIFTPSGNASRGGVAQWLQLSTTGTVLQSGRIGPGNSSAMIGFPSIAVNSGNDVLIGYTSFSTTQYASASYSFRYGTDAPGTMRDEFMFKTGEAPYVKDFGSGRNRWGDYSTTQVDPVNDTDLWTIQEYAMAPGGGLTYRWASHWALLVLCPPAIVNISADPPVLTSSGDHSLRSVGVSVSITGGCAPFVQLLSVSSTEPDAGLGGGDIPADVQSAALGSSDFAVDLRSETGPTSVARVYTMRYRITSGSETHDVAVDVPAINGGVNVDRPWSWAYLGARSSSPPVVLRPASPTTVSTSTSISFTTPSPMVARIGIFTLGGSRVRELIANEVVSGTREITWNGTTDAGAPAANGTYLVQLNVGGQYYVDVVRVERP